MQTWCPFKHTDCGLSIMATTFPAKAPRSPGTVILLSPHDEQLSGVLVGDSKFSPCPEMFWRARLLLPLHSTTITGFIFHGLVFSPLFLSSRFDSTRWVLFKPWWNKVLTTSSRTYKLRGRGINSKRLMKTFILESYKWYKCPDKFEIKLWN